MDALGERLPYVVTLLFAAVGWGVTHTVDRVLKSPVVEYQTKVLAGAKQSSLVVTLRNLSHERVYEDVSITFLLRGKEAGQFISARKTAVPPAWEGDVEPMVTAQSVQFDRLTLHPAWEVMLTAQFNGPVSPVVHLVSAKPTVRLVPPSLETFLLNNEVKVILGALLLWAAILIWLVGARPADKPARKSAE